MAGSNSSGALASFKNKMQTLRDDLEKTREDYEEKCRELEAEKINKNQVCWSFDEISIHSNVTAFKTGWKRLPLRFSEASVDRGTSWNSGDKGGRRVQEAGGDHQDGGWTRKVCDVCYVSLILPNYTSPYAFR